MRPGDLNPQAEKAIESSCYWTNFAARGDPNGKGLPVWPVYNQKSHNRSMILGDSIEIGPAPKASEVDFSEEYYSSLKWHE